MGRVRRDVGDGNESYTKVRAGPTRGPGVETGDVRGERWRPVKASARLVDRH
jgi:hypothetical protein